MSKTELQHLIDCSKITSISGIEEYSKTKNMIFTRLGFSKMKARNYVSVKTTNGTRFRCYFDFPIPLKEPRRKLISDEKSYIPSKHGLIWIYMLHANTPTQSACYIGQTTSLFKRLKYHRHYQIRKRSSYWLWQWANVRKVEVFVCTLGFVHKVDSKSKSSMLATVSEGTWLKRAKDFGYETPAIERWGRLPQSTYKEDWPTELVAEHSMPLLELIENPPEMERICIF